MNKSPTSIKVPSFTVTISFLFIPWRTARAVSSLHRLRRREAPQLQFNAVGLVSATRLTVWPDEWEKRGMERKISHLHPFLLPHLLLSGQLSLLCPIRKWCQEETQVYRSSHRYVNIITISQLWSVENNSHRWARSSIKDIVGNLFSIRIIIPWRSFTTKLPYFLHVWTVTLPWKWKRDAYSWWQVWWCS